MDELIDNDSSSLFVLDAIGTHWEIETYEPLIESVKKKILDRIESFDKTFSPFRTDSLVTEIANASDGGRFQFPDDSVPVFELCDKLHHLTGGALDPLVGKILDQPGNDKNHTLKSSVNAQRSQTHDQRPCWTRDVVRNHKTLVTKRSVVMDISAVGKGCLVDIVSEILFKEQLYEFIIDAGGDIRHSGVWKFPIGMQHPENPENVIGIVDLQDNALCTSAANKRVWGEKLHHIIDATNGLPVQEVVATWVIAKNALIADGLATALFYKSPEKLKARFQFSSVRMFADNTIEKSKNFKGESFFD